MKISFIIPAYNEEKIIGKCLESVTKAIQGVKSKGLTAGGREVDFEILVVNNASKDRTKEIASAYPGVRVVDEMRKGLVWARQGGYEASTGDLLAYIDADTMPPDTWLPKVIEEFRDDPKLLALSGPYIYYDTPAYFRLLTKGFYALGLLVDNISKLLFKSGSLLQGGNFVLRREAVVKIGGFDTRIEFYGEDTDIGRRVGKVGKVKWTFALPMYTTGRRFIQQGMCMTSVRYAVNFIWVTFLGKPFSKTYRDLQTQNVTKN